MGTFACRTIAYNSSNIPIVWVNDCVISQNYDYYWHNVDKHIISEYNYIQQRVFNNSSAIVLSSNWAKNGAINDYNVDPEKNSVFLLGANIEVDEIKKEPHEGINLLFNGVDWERKGEVSSIIPQNSPKTTNLGELSHRY